VGNNMKIMNVIAVAVLSMSMSVFAHDGENKASGVKFKGVDSEPAKVVLAFHKALKSGDKVAARAQLADDLNVLEGGRIERSADEYESHHMGADMKFLASMQSEVQEHQVTIIGDTAISSQISSTKGTYNGKELAYQGMETIVLKKVAGEWKIKHIHWSN